MKHLFTTLAAFSAFTFVSAQTGHTTIKQDPKIDSLLAVYKKSNEQSTIYRIQIGSGDHEKAEKLKSDVAIDFPKLVAKIDFDTPNYKVRIGAYSTRLQAERAYQTIRKKYPEALILAQKKTTK